MMVEKTSQQKANTKQNEARQGSPTFSSVRFKDAKAKAEIDLVIKAFKGTREAALIAAFKLLDSDLKKD